MVSWLLLLTDSLSCETGVTPILQRSVFLCHTFLEYREVYIAYWFECNSDMKINPIILLKYTYLVDFSVVVSPYRYCCGFCSKKLFITGWSYLNPWPTGFEFRIVLLLDQTKESSLGCYLTLSWGRRRHGGFITFQVYLNATAGIWSRTSIFAPTTATLRSYVNVNLQNNFLKIWSCWYNLRS